MKKEVKVMAKAVPKTAAVNTRTQKRLVATHRQDERAQLGWKVCAEQPQSMEAIRRKECVLMERTVPV